MAYLPFDDLTTPKRVANSRMVQQLDGVRERRKRRAQLVGQCREKLVLGPVRVLERLLGKFSLGDVHRDRCALRRTSQIVADHVRRDVHPANAPVLADVALLRVVGAGRIRDGFHDGLDVSAALVGVVEIERPHRQQLLAAVTGDLAVAVVDANEAAFGVGLDRADRGAIEKRAEVCIADLQRVLCCALRLGARGNIDEHARGTHESTIVIVHRTCIRKGCALAAVGANDHELLCVVASALMEGLSHPALVVGEGHTVGRP